MTKQIIAALLAISCFSACQKSDDTTPDSSKVAITITSPKTGQVFHTGDSVAINAAVAYASELHGYEVKVTDSASGLILYDDAQHVHNDNFTIADTWLATPTSASTMKLTITTTINHEGDMASKDVFFKVVP